MTSRTRPSGPARLLWPVAALLALAGVVLLALGAAGTAGRVTGDLVGFTPGQQIEVPAEGMSVWSRSADAREAAVCTLDGTPLLRPVADFTVQVGGQRFHEVARTPDDLAAGTYAATCDGTGAVYAGPYGPATTAPGILGSTGLTLGLVLLPLALVCGVLARLAGRGGSRQATSTAPGATAYPAGGPFAQAGPVAGRAGSPPPPSGPRYDLPPPS